MLQKTILIVEDISDTREMTKFLLEMFGYLVLEVENGKEGAERAILNQPDLILMDISMLVMDGLTATRLIRKLEGDRILIIAVNAIGKIYY